MAEVVLFHHVQGLTDGVAAMAEQLRVEGHAVHKADLFEGERPATIDAGIALVQGSGHRPAAGADPGRVRGALLFESCVLITGDWAFGSVAGGRAVQIHGMDQDPYFAQEGDLDAARELVATVGPERAELFLYPGDRHLFTDSSLRSYDPDAAALVVQRSKAFLARVG